MSGRGAILMLLGVVVAALSCGGGGDKGPTTPANPLVPANPAVLAIDYTSPNVDDGAVLLTVNGSGIDSVRSPYAAVLGTTSNTSRVLLYGNISAGVLARVYIRDAQRQAEYSVALVEVAARLTYLQRSTSSYSVTLRRE